MKCDNCKAEIQTTFLEKIWGTYIGSGKKKKAVCSACQREQDKAK